VQSDRVLKQAVEEAMHYVDIKKQELLEAQELHRQAVDAYENHQNHQAEKLLARVREQLRLDTLAQSQPSAGVFRR
jgi:hypothetical protein